MPDQLESNSSKRYETLEFNNVVYMIGDFVYAKAESGEKTDLPLVFRVDELLVADAKSLQIKGTDLGTRDY